MKAVTRKRSWIGFFSFYALGIASFLIVLFLIRSYFNQRAALSEDTRREIVQTVNDGVKLLDRELQNVTAPVVDLTRSLVQNYSDTSFVTNKVKDLLKEQSMINAAGVAYVPTATDQGRVYHNFVKEDGAVKDYAIDPHYDYTLSSWYRAAESKGAAWIDSYYESASGRYVVRFVAPIYRFDEATGTRLPVAYIFVDISRRELMNSINTLELGGVSNYSMIVSQQGDLISYPVQEFIAEYKTLDNLSRLPGKVDLGPLAERIQRGGQGMTNYYDDLSDDSFFVYFAPIRNTNWFFVLFSHREDFFYQVDIRHKMIQVGCMALLLMLFLLFFATQPMGSTTKRWWIVAMSFSFFVMCVLGFQLHLSYVTAQKMPSGELIGNRVDLNRFSYFIERRNEQLGKPPLLTVPTGIWIEYILSEKERIMLSGIIWQRYSNTLPEGIDKTVGMLNADDLDLEKLYEVKKDKDTLIGWRFKASLNVEFDYETYPFDSQILTAKLFHPDFERNIMLVPDFDSYSLSEIAGKTGLGKVYKEASWTIKRSYFSYELSNAATNFGIPDSVRQEQFPNLFYNIIVTRDVTAPLIGYVFPLSIMAAILFYVLLEASITKVSLSSALARVSGLFLATVFAHLSLRNGLEKLAGTGSGGLTFLEYLYFIMYFFIMLTLNFIFYIHFRRKGDDLDDPIANGLKFMYWPLLALCSLAVTLYFFY